MPIIKQKAHRTSLEIRNKLKKTDRSYNDSSFNSLKPFYSDYDVTLRTRFNQDPQEPFRVITRQKKYLNREKIKFDNGEVPKQLENFLKVFAKRRSRRVHLKSSRISNKKLGLLLKYSFGICDFQKKLFRNLPSGGQRYPLEIYVVLFNEKKYKNSISKIYHYDILEHSLNLVTSTLNSKDLDEIFRSDKNYVLNASALLFVTAVTNRTEAKYRHSTEKLIFTELGHLGQNLWLICELLKFSFFPISAIWEKPFYNLLKINPLTERFLSAFVISTRFEQVRHLKKS